jgi:uncharacterized membrane protein YjjP (DUF1212 family)
MTPVVEIIPADHREATEFLVELARALAANGSTADRIERALSTTAERIGLHAEFFATPTSVFASVGTGAMNSTRLVRVESADINLDRLTRLDAILQGVSAREITIAQAREQVAQTLDSPSPWPASFALLAHTLTGACATLLFGGRWRELAIGAAAGLTVGLLAFLADRVRRLLRVFEFLSGAVVAALATLAAHFLPGLTTDIVIVAGLIALIPGLSLTIAVSEVATRHLLAGASRLIGAAASLASIAFGVAAGSQLVRALVSVSPARPTDPLPAPAQWTALALAPLALAVLFKANARDVPAILCIAAIGFLCARELGDTMGPELAAGASALVVGLLANARAIWSNRPVAVGVIPGLILLVPGSIGFRSLNAFLDQKAVQGLETAVLAVIVALAIATGLLLANVLLPPKRAL